jgi:hypothetical protein
MADCTHKRKLCSHVRSVIPIAAAVIALAAHPGSARADGDPASDVLATQTLFLPQDAGIPLAQRGQLSELLRDATRNGYQIRVALIATRSDLGSVTELWRRPQTYAEFLGQELSLVYRGPLLVVVPTGVGFWSPGSSGAPERSVLGPVRIASGGEGLALAALSAVQHLAMAAGHPVAISSPSASVAGGRSTDTTAIVAFGIGAALIVLAWAASLRARPPRVLRRGDGSA